VRDIRLQISINRTDLSKLQYLAETNGEPLSRFVYRELQCVMLEHMPPGSDQAYYYDLAMRLKRAGQGFREIEQGELDQRVKEAIEYGASGKLPSCGDRTEPDQGALSSVPVPSTEPRSAKRNRRQRPRAVDNETVVDGSV
jgi:hypothetical protein